MKPLACLLAATLAGCAAQSYDPAEFARLEPRARDRCAVARADDFAGAGETELRRYLALLAQREGPIVALDARDVTLAVVRGEPEPGLVGVTAGEVACGLGGDDPPFRITLYEKALVGRPLYVAYQTVAHEFQHVVQIRRDHLRCAPEDGLRDHYEREAAAVAERLVPACP